MSSNNELTKSKVRTEPDLSTYIRVFGALVYLSQGSPLHNKYSTELLRNRVGPSLANNSYRYYECQQFGPIAFVNWALLSDKVLEDVLSTGRDPAMHEWESGENIYFLELIAPFGHCHRVVRDLRQSVFPKGQRAFGIRGEIIHKSPRKIRIQNYRA